MGPAAIATAIVTSSHFLQDGAIHILKLGRNISISGSVAEWSKALV